MVPGGIVGSMFRVAHWHDLSVLDIFIVEWSFQFLNSVIIMKTKVHLTEEYKTLVELDSDCIVYAVWFSPFQNILDFNVIPGTCRMQHYI